MQCSVGSSVEFKNQSPKHGEAANDSSDESGSSSEDKNEDAAANLKMSLSLSTAVAKYIYKKDTKRSQDGGNVSEEDESDVEGCSPEEDNNFFLTKAEEKACRNREQERIAVPDKRT